MDVPFQGSRGQSLQAQHPPPPPRNQHPQRCRQELPVHKHSDTYNGHSRCGEILGDWLDFMQDVCCNFRGVEQQPNEKYIVHDDYTTKDLDVVKSRRLFMTTKEGDLGGGTDKFDLYLYASLSCSDSDDEDNDDAVPILLSYEHNMSILHETVSETPIHTFESRQQGTCPLGHQEIILFKHK